VTRIEAYDRLDVIVEFHPMSIQMSCFFEVIDRMCSEIELIGF